MNMNSQSILRQLKNLFHLYISSNRLFSGWLFCLVEQVVSLDANRASELSVLRDTFLGGGKHDKHRLSWKRYLF